MLTGVGLAIDDIAYLNALPYRAGAGNSNAAFPNTERKKVAATVWVRPMLDALMPRIIIAHSKMAGEVISIAIDGTNHPEPLFYDRERVKSRRDAKNAEFRKRLREALECNPLA
jgi:hypothetical protein